MKIWTCLGQITPLKIDEICPLAIPNLISLLSIHIASMVKIPCYLLKLSSGNEKMGVSRPDNSVNILRNLPISNPKADLCNINAYSKFYENPLLFTQVITRNETMGVSRADNSVKIWRNLPISNPKPDLLNVNVYSKLVKIPCYLLKL